jgi:hypothetical protein
MSNLIGEDEALAAMDGIIPAPPAAIACRPISNSPRKCW